MTSRQKRMLYRILAGAGLLAIALLLPTSVYFMLRLALFLAAYLATGSDVLLKAARNIAHGRVLMKICS